MLYACLWLVHVEKSCCHCVNCYKLARSYSRYTYHSSAASRSKGTSCLSLSGDVSSSRSRSSATNL